MVTNPSLPPDTPEAVLKELFRLYQWRNALGKIEKTKDFDKEQMRRDLLTYGKEKKIAWERAETVLARLAEMD